MPELDHILRGLLAALALLALLLSGSFFGSIWLTRTWPVRLVCIGLFGVLVYGFAGQIKAFNLNIPFDGFSAIGLVAYTILVAGQIWHYLRDQQSDRRGR